MPVVFAADAVPEEITVSAKRLEEELPQDLARTGTRVDTVTAEQVQNVGYLDFVPGSALEYYFGYDLQKYGGRDQVLVITQKDETTHAVFGQIRTSDSWLPNARLAAGVRYNIPQYGQSELIWNTSGQYDISSALFVRASLGTTFRLPTA